MGAGGPWSPSHPWPSIVVALGCYTALMLLVVSMEEGGDNLTVGTTSLTQAVVLLVRDRGFRTPIRSALTITPLLLTILLIWLINCTHHANQSIRAACVCCRIDCLAPG